MSLSFFKRRWFLFVSLLVFVLCKLPHLNIAFYWDESWVYAPSVMEMYDHGPSLLPDAIPFSYSRGHPLLFQAACAAWMHIFGTDHAAMHSFALFLSVILTTVIYETIMLRFNQRAAMICLALLLLSHSYFIESSLVLNDLMLGLFMLLSVWFYAHEKLLISCIFITLTYYTKESGFILAPVIAVDIAVSLVRKQYDRKTVWKFCTLIFPLLMAGIFYIIQKKTLGWYLNPGHTNLIDLNIEHTNYNIVRSLRYIFHSDSMNWMWWILGLLSVVAAALQKKMKYLIFTLTLAVIYLLLYVFNYNDAIAYVFIAYLIITFILFIARKQTSLNPIQKRYLYLLSLCTVFYIYFCSINFYETRYLFPAFIFAMMALGLLFDHFIRLINPSFFTPVLALIITVGLSTFSVYNDELTIITRVQAQQDLVSYMEKNNFYNKRIYVPAYLEYIHLKEYNTGFLTSRKNFINLTQEYDPNAELMIFDQIEGGPSDTLVDASKYTLLHHIQRKNVWIKIFSKRTDTLIVEQN